MLAHNSYIKKLASKFKVLDKRSLLSILFLTTKLSRYKREALKQEIKAY